MIFKKYWVDVDVAKQRAQDAYDAGFAEGVMENVRAKCETKYHCEHAKEHTTDKSKNPCGCNRIKERCGNIRRIIICIPVEESNDKPAK